MSTAVSPDRAPFPHHLYSEGPTRIIPFDLSKQLGCPGPPPSCAPSASFIRIRAGESLQTQPNATSEIYYAIRGHGRTRLAGGELRWEQGDYFALPAGSGAEHHAQTDSAFFKITDEPLLRHLTETKLLWWRPHRAGRPPGKRTTGTAKPASRRPPVCSRPSAGTPLDFDAQPGPSTLHSPQLRRTRRLPVLVLTAVLCGLLVAWGARSIQPRGVGEGRGGSFAAAAGPAGALHVGGPEEPRTTTKPPDRRVLKMEPVKQVPSAVPQPKAKPQPSKSRPALQEEDIPVAPPPRQHRPLESQALVECVNIPAGGVIYTDGIRMKSPRFFTPNRLLKNVQYFYLVRVEYRREDGQVFSDERRVVVSAGQTVTVDFGPQQ